MYMQKYKEKIIAVKGRRWYDELERRLQRRERDYISKLCSELGNP